MHFKYNKMIIFVFLYSHFVEGAIHLQSRSTLHCSSYIYIWSSALRSQAQPLSNSALPVTFEQLSHTWRYLESRNSAEVPVAGTRACWRSHKKKSGWEEDVAAASRVQRRRAGHLSRLELMHAVGGFGTRREGRGKR